MRETVRTNQKIYWFLWKVSPSQLIVRSDLDIFFLISKTYSSSSSSSRAWTPPLARTYVSAALKSDNGVSGSVLARDPWSPPVRAPFGAWPRKVGLWRQLGSLSCVHTYPIGICLAFFDICLLLLRRTWIFMVLLEMSGCCGCAPWWSLALISLEKFQGLVAVTLNTRLTFRERIHTNMCTVLLRTLTKYN